MDFSIAKEVSVFLASVLSGLCICVVYDLLRTIRAQARPSAALTNVEDALFWTLAALIMFFSVFYANQGQVRWYEFVGAILGAILYFFTLSRLVLFLFHKIIEFFSKFFLFFCKILLTPLRFTFNIVYRCILFIFVPIYRLSTRCFCSLGKKMKTEARRAKAVLLRK